MRVAYVNWIPRPSAWPGLVDKLRHQAKALGRSGLPWEVLVLSDELAGERDGVRYLPIPPVALGGLRRRVARCALIEQALDWQRYDRVLLRYPGAADLSCTGLLDRHGDMIFSEHHTDEPQELRTLVRGPSSWAKWRAECAWGPRWLAGVAGIVAVTPEILALEQRRHRTRRGLALGNGISVADVAPTGSQLNDGVVSLLFSCARFWSWQGLDRLLRGLLEYRGPARVIVHLAGIVVEPADRLLLGRLADHPHVRLIEHGMLDGAALDRVAATCTLGIGTLALGRKHLREACTLKSRDYAARGLPFVFAHQDPDLPDDLPGILRLADDGTAISIARMLAFAHELTPDIPARLRAFAAARLDWSHKLLNLHHFLGGH